MEGWRVSLERVKDSILAENTVKIHAGHPDLLDSVTQIALSIVLLPRLGQE
jgi:hypothetical protein